MGRIRVVLVDVCLLLAYAVYGEACAQGGQYCSASCNEGQLERIACRCDPQCALYGDCCVDFWDNCVHRQPPESRLRPILHSEYAEYFGCVSNMGSEYIEESYTVVHRCPSEWPQDQVRNHCENETLARDNKLLNLFLTGPEDIVFKNFYCTVCHGVNASSLQAWRLELWGCDEHEIVASVEGQWLNCSRFISSPPKGIRYKPHRCYPGIIDSCPLDHSETSSAEAHLCVNHSSLLLPTHLQIIFKNVHCLRCNLNNTSVNLDTVECSQLIPQTGRIPLKQSYLLMFDFISQQVKRTSKSFDARSHILGDCSQWQIYDPFEDVCRDLMFLDKDSSVQWTSWRDGETSSAASSSQPCRDCLQTLWPAIAQNTSFQEETCVWSTRPAYEARGQPRHSLALHTTFSEAGHLRDSIDVLLSNVTRPTQFTVTMCSATTVVVVASFKREERHCQGYTLGGVVFTNLSASAGEFSLNLSGFVYTAREFVHETEFSFDLNQTKASRRESVTLCSPFVGESACSLLSLPRRDVYQLDDGIVIHKSTGLPLSSEEIWQLPDGSLRVCRFSQTMLLSYVTQGSSGFSLVTVVMTLITYAIFPSLRNTPGKVVMNLLVSHALAHLILMIDIDLDSWLCQSRAAALHFTWLAAFSWMSVLAFGLTYSLRYNVVPARPLHPDGIDRWKMLKYSAYAWGLPLVVMSVCLLASSLSHGSWFEYGGSECWIVNPIHSLLVFGLPVVLNIVFNVCMFAAMVQIVVTNHRRLVASNMARRARSAVFICMKLGVITGLTWTLFIAANFAQMPVLWYISVLVNSLHGALIALVFLLKANVRDLWRVRLSGWACRFRGLLVRELPVQTNTGTTDISSVAK